jgi:hypothetical protein
MLHEKTKTEQEINGYKTVDSYFVDYVQFEGETSRRNAERDAFINNQKYTPEYNYPKLDFLIDDVDISEKKTAIYEAVMELEAAKKGSPNANIAELELYAAFHEVRLKRIMLVEAARNLSDTINSEVNRVSFSKLNKELYGEFDNLSYLGMIATEKSRLSDFVPKSELAMEVKSELESLLSKIETDGHKEDVLLDEDTIKTLHDYIIKRYHNVLDVIPNTDDSIYYDIDQCIEIFNKTLEAGGLAEYGWRVVENPEKPNPSTDTDDLTINLPSDTRRNASELRRLIIHEQETHARRGQSGIDSNIKPLEDGTADYADVEEGLGIILECALDGNINSASISRARNRYITVGLALGVGGQPRDARETYETLWRTLAVQKAVDGKIDEKIVESAKKIAYSHIANSYRGTQFWMKGVIYTKSKIYYEGLVKNAEYFKNNINDLDRAFKDIFIGKYNHTSEAEKVLVLSAINTKNRSLT